MAPVIAYNFGACNNAELKSLLRKSMLLLTIFGLTLTALAEVFSGPIALMFVGYDSALTEFTTHAFRIYMISNLLVGFNMFTSAFFTALNNGVVSAFAAFTRSIIFEISAVFLLPLWLGIDGIWLSITVAEVLSLIVSLSLLLAFRRRYVY
jgi:Na+-driven multidrug efflux pump